MDSSTVILIGNVLLFAGSMITLYFSRRSTKADTITKLEAIIDKVQDRADKLYDDKVAGEVAQEKLRNDLAIALVNNADLNAKLAEKTGYIQGMTDPLIKLQEEQKKALAGGRRATDGK